MRVLIQFDQITRLEEKDWKKLGVLGDHKPGTILLLNDWGIGGGVLRLTRQGHLMMLTEEQVYGGAPIFWPYSDMVFSIRGVTVVFE